MVAPLLHTNEKGGVPPATERVKAAVLRPKQLIKLDWVIVPAIAATVLIVAGRVMVQLFISLMVTV